MLRGGVNIVNAKKTFIGENVIFDTNYPEDITIEPGVLMDPSIKTYSRGKVHIKKNVYIGCNSIICKSVTIGENAIIGAGSIINKDIPGNEVWAGNPVRFIRKLK